MNDSLIEYMLMSGNSYDSTRPLKDNKVPIPQGWSALPDPLKNRLAPSSGFEAAAYEKEESKGPGSIYNFSRPCVR